MLKAREIHSEMHDETINSGEKKTKRIAQWEDDRVVEPKSGSARRCAGQSVECWPLVSGLIYSTKAIVIAARL
ncbi:Uncharacterized protein APZ42_025056 [Daphnia magna]|uniref:Uncharacterized protein n=1 Tax=Daphnia magna TaxID=35525 RepID=A0A0N7ZJ54_9CRUS|nr:Uncharacterized protein APZ42_025056 [Daphnia magna]